MMHGRWMGKMKYAGRENGAVVQRNGEEEEVWM
jgi:hypothetical protein